MPAGLNKLARIRAAAGRGVRPSSMRTVGRSSGAFAPPVYPSQLLSPRASGRRSFKMAPKGHRAAQFRQAAFRKSTLGIAGVGMGALAMSRNTGRSMDRTRGRPTGVYQY